MGNPSDRMRRARERNANQPFAAPQPAPDANPIMITNGEARVVSNETSAHMRQKMAGEANVQDFDPNRAAQRQPSQGDPEIFGSAGAKNARPHLPEGSQNVRTPNSQRHGPLRRQQSAVRDRQAPVPGRAGEGNVQAVRGSMGMSIHDSAPAGAPGGWPQPQQPQLQQPPQFQQPQLQQPPQFQQPQLQQPPQFQQPQFQQPQQPQFQQPQFQQPQGPTQAPQQPQAPLLPQTVPSTLVGSGMAMVPMAFGPAQPGGAVADLTVILTTFRRPQLLRPQLQALADQSLRAADVWIWANDWGGGAGMHDHEAESHYNFVRAKSNMGPWARFLYASLVPTKYVLILDDDCIPGRKWIENAIEHLERLESQGAFGVICASGRVFGADDPGVFSEVGPSNPPDESYLVDEGTKGWLMPSVMLDMFHALPRVQAPVGWGFHISAACQQAGAMQLVLAYDGEAREGWGTLGNPGADPVSLSQGLAAYEQARTDAWHFYRDPEFGGWRPMVTLDEEEAEGASLGESQEPSSDPTSADALTEEAGDSTE